MNPAAMVWGAQEAVNEFHRRGFQMIPSVLTGSECDSLSAELTELFANQQGASRNRIGGVRNLLRRSQCVRELAVSSRISSLIKEVTGESVFPVRAIFFDKTAGSNWRVPWHQDLTIAVTDRNETGGFGPWSVKEGVVHVQPSLAILAGMVALRLHLDNCDRNNGALRVVPGSHREGELRADQIASLTGSDQVVICELPRGGALFMRPLLLHASSPAASPSHRRVLHIEYAANELPNGLEWYDR